MSNRIDLITEADVAQNLAFGDMFWNGFDRWNHPVLYLIPGIQVNVCPHNRLPFGVFILWNDDDECLKIISIIHPLPLTLELISACTPWRNDFGLPRACGLTY